MQENNADLRVIDFGLSRFYKRGKKMRNACGTILYVAPEVLRESYDEKCDLWSLGCIVFVMLFGYPPFDGESETEVMDQLLQDKPFTIDDDDDVVISDEAKDFLLKLIERNPRKRLSAKQAMKVGSPRGVSCGPYLNLLKISSRIFKGLRCSNINVILFVSLE